MGIGSSLGQLFVNIGLKSTIDRDAKTAQSSLGRLSGGIQKHGLMVGAAATAMGASMVLAGDQINSAYADIRIGTGATGEALDDLKDSFHEVYGTIPAEADAVSGALANMNTLTRATGETLEELTTHVLEVSRMLGEDGVNNAQSFGEAMKQWQIPAEEGTALMDQMFKITQDTGIGFGELTNALNTYGPVMQNANFSTIEAAELFGELKSSGIAVSRVMPGLNKAFRTWAEEGKNGREELEKQVDAIKNAKSNTEALTIATGTFGAEGAQRMTTAIRNGTFELESLGEGLQDVDGLIAETAKETLTLSDKFGLLKTKMTEALAPFEGVGYALTAIGPLLMALGPALSLASAGNVSFAVTAKGAIASTWAFTTALLANPLFWIAAIIIGVVAALYILEKKFAIITKTVAFFKDAFTGLKDKLLGTKDSTEDLADAQKDLADSAREVDELTESYEKLEGAITDVKGLTEDYDDNLRSVEHATFDLEDAQADYNKAVKDFGKNSREAAKADLRVRDAEDRLNDAKERSTELEEKKIALMREYGVTTIAELETIQAKEKTILAEKEANLNVIERIEAEAEAKKKERLERMTGFLREHWDKVLLGIPVIGQVIYAYRNWDEITTILSGVKEKVFTHFETLKVKFTEFYEKVKMTFTDIKTAIEERVSTLLATIKQPFIDGYDYITGLPETFKSAGEALIDALVDGIKARKDAIIAEIKSAFGPFERFLAGSDAKEGPLSHLTESGKAVWGTFAAGMESARPDIGGTFEKTLPTVTGKGIMGGGGVSYGGDTYNLGPVTITNDYDVERMWAKIQELQQAKRIQRGINAI